MSLIGGQGSAKQMFVTVFLIDQKTKILFIDHAFGD
jgi:hypothetical protein